MGQINDLRSMAERRVMEAGGFPPGADLSLVLADRGGESHRPDNEDQFQTTNAVLGAINLRDGLERQSRFPCRPLSRTDSFSHLLCANG